MAVFRQQQCESVLQAITGPEVCLLAGVLWACYSRLCLQAGVPIMHAVLSPEHFG